MVAQRLWLASSMRGGLAAQLHLRPTAAAPAAAAAAAAATDAAAATTVASKASQLLLGRVVRKTPFLEPFVA